MKLPHIDGLIKRARAAVADFQEASEGDSGDAEHDAAVELVSVIEELLKVAEGA